MKLRVANLALPVGASEESLYELVAQKLDVLPGDVHDLRIRRRSLDARKRTRLQRVYTVIVDVDLTPDAVVSLRGVDQYEEPEREKTIPGNRALSGRPVVIGAGPAGLFAAWRLACEGYAPVLLERGKPVEERRRDTTRFWKHGVLDPESNVLFGEGGAGTFSDGKLTARTKDPRQETVLDLLVACGAPAEVRYDSRAHLGTDSLPKILQNLRQSLVEAGTDVRFNSCVRGIESDESGLAGVVTSEGTHQTNAAILAIGHSARDTYQSLFDSGVLMEQKPFAAGIRVQHRQEIINRSQYGSDVPPEGLEAAEYILKRPTTKARRAVYSFCMCPGGSVIPCASAHNELFCNGMSGKNRGGPFANGAVVAQVPTSDFPGNSPLAGVEYQRMLETAAFEATGGTYALPMMPLDDLVRNRPPAEHNYALALRRFPRSETVDLRNLLPDGVLAAISEASFGFSRSVRGWHGSGAVAFGVETRTSAPVRIPRGQDGQSLSTPGLFPTGEGAGYAGGIVSAAVDGIRMAEALITAFSRP